MRTAAPDLDRLHEAALQQPGATRRDFGVKFRCPACAADGHDEHRDNACLFNDGTWGCAWAKDTGVGRAHWDAIGRALGAFDERNGRPSSENDAGTGASEKGGEAAAPWPAPEPVPCELPAVPAFDPARLLPASLSPWVADIAERAQCPPDFVAVAALVAVAAVVGRSLTIRPKQHDDWTVVPNLWGLAVGRPGIMKSPAMHEAMKPLHRLIADARLDHQRKMAAHEFLEAEASARHDALKKRLRDAVARGEPTDELRHAFEAALAYTAPTERRYLLNDSTVEKLGELLNQNPNGLLVFRDELNGFLRTMDREGHENDRAFYCEAWNGTGRYTYDRIGRGTTHIEAACISILGGLQPGPLHAYLREVFGDGAADDGLIQRFQLAVYPDVERAWRNVDRWPDTDATRRVVELFQGLARLDVAKIAAHTDDPEAVPFLRFTPEAQARFDAWRATLEHDVRGGDEHPVVVSHLAKYRSLLPSLALLFHVLDCVDRGIGGPVSDAATERAVAWCAYLGAHARRIYYSVTEGPRLAAAALAAKIAAGAIENPFRARAVVRHAWAGLTESEEVFAAIDWLVDLHWLRSEELPPARRGGRPTVQYRINPAALVTTR